MSNQITGFRCPKHAEHVHSSYDLLMQEFEKHPAGSFESRYIARQVTDPTSDHYRAPNYFRHLAPGRHRFYEPFSQQYIRRENRFFEVPEGPFCMPPFHGEVRPHEALMERIRVLNEITPTEGSVSVRIKRASERLRLLNMVHFAKSQFEVLDRDHAVIFNPYERAS